MNQISIYQHPFVDVFKLVKLSDWTVAQKEGDVEENVWDQKLAKNYIRIQGVTSSANYIQVPATKHLPKKPLGLIGRFLYLLINKPDGKNCVMHFDYMVNETRLAKISLSNIYKEFKNLNGTSLQIPLQIQSDRWVVVCINVGDLIEQQGLYLPNQPKKFFLRSFQICSTVSVRGVFTSDIQYQAHTLPKDMQFKLTGKENNWFAQYSWFQYPSLQNQQTDEPVNQKQEEAKTKEQTKKVRIEGGVKNGLTKKADVKKVGQIGKQIRVEETKGEDQSGNEIICIQEGVNREEEEELNGKVEKTIKEIEQLRQEYSYNLSSKHLPESAQLTIYEDKPLLDRHKPGDPFILKPNPLMRLDRVVGWHPNYTSGQVFFNRDPKLSSEILYSQANLLVGFYPPLQKQRLFFDRQTNNIDQVFVESCPGFRNFAFTVSKSLETNAKDKEVTVWSLDSTDTTNAQSTSIFTFKPPLKSINSISISCGEEMENLAVGGKDQQARDAIIVYRFSDLIKLRKVEIIAKQLADFDMFFCKFNSVTQNSIIACGKENIKFYKIKNGHLPGQSVLLNNTARGKVFHQAVVQPSPQSQNGQGQKPGFVYVATTDGLLYFVDFFTRQIDKIIQIHEGCITSLLLSPNQEFLLTSSQDGVLRIWSTDFTTLKSEVKTGNAIAHCDINVHSNQICVLSSQSGIISVLNLEESSYNIILRSHMDNIVDVAHNQMMKKLVTIANDYCIKIWDSETMEQVNEFISENDLPVRVKAQNQGEIGEEEASKCPYTDTLVAIGFKSGFLRILDLSEMRIIHETLYFQSPVRDVDFSRDNRLMGVFFKSGKIVIVNKERAGEFTPIKNIDFELPDQNYFSLAFSPDSAFMANTSSNANIITVWETRNFSLRFSLDVTGDTISKLIFAPNGKDLVLLTTSSKLKYYRIPIESSSRQLEHIKDSYDITEMECVDFQISSNNKYLLCCGKEGVIKIFDYLMRGENFPVYQAYQGHFKHPHKAIFTRDLRHLFSIGEWNGIYKWNFYGDREGIDTPQDIFESLPGKQDIEQVKTKSYEEQLAELEAEEAAGGAIFEQDQLMKKTQEQVAQLNNKLYKGSAQPRVTKPKAREEEDFDKDRLVGDGIRSAIDINLGGYLLEHFEIKLKKVLACSNGEQVKNNLVWNVRQKYLAYSVFNLVVIESMNQEKTQRLLKDGNDQIYMLKFSPNHHYLLAYSRTGPIDGFPCIYIYDPVTFKKLNQIAISDAQIDSVEFSGYSNMLLVVSSTQQDKDVVNSTISVWDFMDGHRDLFCKSTIPIRINNSCWNPYLEKNSDEFVTVSDKCYHFWRMDRNLQLMFQEGEMPQKESESFRDKGDGLTALCFVRPDSLHHSVYLLIGTKSGYIWVTDTRVNQFLYSVKVLDNDQGAVRRIFSSEPRIVVEGERSSQLFLWDQSGKNGENEYSPQNPFNLFRGVQDTLSIDGFFTGSSYDETGNQVMALSSSGSIWYLNWIEHVTLRLKSCHHPSARINSADFKYVSPNEFTLSEEQDQHYTFDQNYEVASASSDGQIKVWGMFDIEYHQQFLVPREQCNLIAMHQFKPFMIAAYTDGFIRFFDLSQSKLLGRCQIFSPREKTGGERKFDAISKEEDSVVDQVVALKVLPSGNQMLGATRNGQVVLIFVNSWNPLSIKIESLVSMQTSIHNFDFSYLEPYNKWLVGTSNGKVVVYNRKDFNSLNQEVFQEDRPPQFNFMDSFNLQDYVDNGFSQARRCNTLDHYYSMAKRNLVFNEVDELNECEGIFVNNDLALYVCFIKKCNFLFIRNFELHQVVRRISISQTSLPFAMHLLPGSSPFVCMALKDNSIRLVDYMNESNFATTETMHEELTAIRLCPNGKYILTAGNRGDVFLWGVSKKILEHGVIRDAVRVDK